MIMETVMVNGLKEVQKALSAKRIAPVPWWAWLPILIADGGVILWGGMAALAPGSLPGPAGTPILTAEYHGFTGGSWQELVRTSPRIADFMTVLFRVYGAYCVAFGLLTAFITLTAFRRRERWAWWALLAGNTIAFGSAIAFDHVVNAIGIFEMTEYLGIGLIYLCLAMTSPFRVRRSS
jgi:RsiW-degrading membrane proteinase PrsW (M82 family)